MKSYGLIKVYYKGTAEQWDSIYINKDGNGDVFNKDRVIFNYTDE